MSAHAVVSHSTQRAGFTVRKLLCTLAITALSLMGATAAFANNGLKGDYYNGRNFETFRLTRVDPTINFDWGGGAPDALINNDNYTIRWTGYVLTTTAGEYTFTSNTDDGVRVWVAGQLIIDKWIDQGPTDWSGKITLAAGSKYDIKMEFYENGGGAVARLRWTPPGGSSAIIPAANLCPPEANIVATPTIDPANALITGSVLVSMASATPGAEIHYTTDLSAPTTSSPLYTGSFPLTVTAPVYVSAQAYKNGLAASATKTVKFSPGELNFANGVTNQNVSTIQFNVDSIRNGTVIQVTGDLWDQLGSVFSIGTVDITSFNTVFTFTQRVGDPQYVAEGMTFCVQNNSPGAIGSGSSRRLGYFGIPNSIAVKFDVYKNDNTPDPSSSSTGLYINGAVTEGGIDLLPLGIDLRSGQVMRCEVNYAGSTLTVKLKNTVTNVEVTHTYPNIDLPAIVGGSRAYVGFTGTTSSVRTIEQQVRTWTYTTNSAVITGDLTLEGSTRSNVPITFEFRPQDNSGNFTRTVTPAENGSFTVSVPRKNYIVGIKGSKWLRETVVINVSSGDSLNNNITLLGGDATNDNFVDVEDLNQLIQAFDADPSSPNWNQGKADFNLDDIVDVNDLSMLIRNFDAEGDP